MRTGDGLSGPDARINVTLALHVDNHAVLSVVLADRTTAAIAASGGL
jgi:hypothetical protein